jgi:glycosyltransferase involved in cell wall biosynthesis
MRIGINLFDFWSPGSRGEGVLNYVRGLTHGLSQLDPNNEYVLFVNELNRREFENLSPRFRCLTVKLDPRKKHNRVFWEQALLPFEFKKNKLDVIHFPGGTASLALLRNTVVTYHAANVAFYAGSFRKHAFGLKQFYISAMEKLITPRAAQLITDSEFSKRDMVEKLGVSPNKIRVVYLTVPKDDNRVGSPCELDFPYILDVTSSALHKNLRTLIAAYALLKEQLSSAPKLVIAGALPDQPAWGMHQRQELECYARQVGLADDVVFIPYPSRQRLIALFQHAVLFVFPSLFEGFGLAPLEAMMYGLPVVLSDRASLPEVGGDAAVYINPEDAKDIARGMEMVLSDGGLRQSLIERGLRRAKSFGSWTRVAADTLATYSTVFDSHRQDKTWGIVRKEEA